jgi:hypothetical protein
VIRIDVHTVGEKPDKHDMYTSRASPHSPHVCFLRAVHVCGNLSLAINSVGRTLLLPKKRAPDTIPSTPAGRYAGLSPSFSPKTAIEIVMKAKYLLTISYIDLLDP